MQELKSVQIVVKIARILSIILLVCYIIAAVGGTFSLVLINAMKGMDINGQTFEKVLEESAKMSLVTINSVVTSALIFCVVGCVLAVMAIKVFKAELKLGTPFVESWAKRLLNFGIIEVCVSVGVGIVVAAVQSAFIRAGAVRYDFSSGGMLATGLFFIVCGLV